MICNAKKEQRQMMVRWMCGVSLMNRILSKELNRWLGVEGVTHVVRHGRLIVWGGLDNGHCSQKPVIVGGGGGQLARTLYPPTQPR